MYSEKRYTQSHMVKKDDLKVLHLYAGIKIVIKSIKKLVMMVLR